MPRDAESPVWPFHFRQGDRVMDIVMQHENEVGRVVLVGRRTDNGAQCSVIVIREFGGAWALYPHGVSRLGVRLGKGVAVTMARAILAATE